MAALLLFDNYRYNTVYANDVPRCMYRSYHLHRYEAIIQQFPNDPVGFRRLVLRDFSIVRDIPVCFEHTVCRVATEGLLSDWSLDVTIFRTGNVPPVRWNENNIPPPFRVNEHIQYDPATQGSALLILQAQINNRDEDTNLENMNINQDILSQL